MQACQAYYERGHFIPLSKLTIPEGSRAIITIMEESPNDVSQRQKAALARFREAVRNSEPLPPEFDEIMSQHPALRANRGTTTGQLG
jgi:predicted DNA-binding antitoxin AbrB/MazE fold protein